MFINPCSRLKIYSDACIGSQEKYMKYVNFPWLPVEAALSMSTFCILLTRDWKLLFLIYTLLMVRLYPKQIAYHQALVNIIFNVEED